MNNARPAVKWSCFQSSRVEFRTARRSFSEEDSVVFEISQRGISEIRKAAERTLLVATEVTLDAVQGVHGKVAILKHPSDVEQARMLDWIKSEPADKAKLEDIAVFLRSPLDNIDARLDSLIGPPAMFATTLKMQNGLVIARASAQIAIADAGAQRILEDEAAQLPKEVGGVVVLDISSVVGGLDEWTPLIQRRLQPNINRRIRAVILFWKVSAEIKSAVIVNPHARNPLSASAKRTIEHMLS